MTKRRGDHLVEMGVVTPAMGDTDPNYSNALAEAGTLSEQYAKLIAQATKEDGDGLRFVVWNDAWRWTIVRNVASEQVRDAHGYAHETVQKEKEKATSASAPEHVAGASDRLGEELRSWSEKVLSLWDGKGFLWFRNHYEDDYAEEGRPVPSLSVKVERVLRLSIDHEESKRLDAEFLDLLRTIGSNGEKLARTLEEGFDARDKARDDIVDDCIGPHPRDMEASSFDIWESEFDATIGVGTHKPPRWVVALSLALWLDVVRPQLEREHNKPAALVRPVYVDTVGFFSRRNTFDRASQNLTFEGRRLASLAGADASIDLSIIEDGLGLLGSVLSHRLLRWEVQTGHHRLLAGEAYPNVLDVEGGWTGLARQLGFKEKDVPDLKRLVYAQAHFRFTFPDGSSGNLLSYVERPATGQDKARLSITLGTPLLPSYVNKLPKRADRKLIPYPREAPPLTGRANEHGQQLTMALLLVAELRERAPELAQEGAVHLPHDEWIRLADRAGLPRKLLLPVRNVWLQGDTRAVPFIKAEKTDCYTLSDAHLAERDFLIEAGKMELQGAKAGARGVAKKRKRLARLGK